MSQSSRKAASPTGLISCTKLIAASSLLLAAAAIDRPAFAQGEAANTGDVEPVCMTRPLSDLPQVPQESRGQPFRIVTGESVVGSLEAKGFERVECSVADLVTAGKRGSWRDEICTMAATGNVSVQNQLERALGERPAVLCAAAEMVAGAWDRRSTGNAGGEQ